MRPAAKKYTTTYKKKVDVERDMYLPRRSPRGIIQCTGCGAFYVRRHWTLNSPPGFSNPVNAHPTHCPACLKIRDRFPGGELHLLNVERGDRSEIARILRNEEERARMKNSLERIMRMDARNGGMEGGDDHGKAGPKTWPFDQEDAWRQAQLQVGSQQ